MAHFQDLAECNYLPASEGLGFKAVGWLERGHDYLKGDVTPEFFEKLLVLLQNHWASPVACAGFHCCDFCRFSGGNAHYECNFGAGTARQYRFSGRSNGFLFVPHAGTLFVSPLSIPHYVDAHEYCPPPSFQRAVIECPEMRSVAYLREMMATPARAWLQKLGMDEPTA